MASDHGELGGGGGGGEGGGRRRRLEGVIPEILKRAVEIGVEKATEAPDAVKHLVGDLKLPKEVAGYILSQVDETKNGIVRVVAKEVRDFLEHTNLAGEMQKMLTTLQFEVNTTIRFRPNDAARAGDRTRDAAESGDDREARKDEESSDASASKEKAEDAGRRASTPLPKPEVKTDMYVKREERREPRRKPRE
jgi:hypothetical protein